MFFAIVTCVVGVQCGLPPITSRKGYPTEARCLAVVRELGDFLGLDRRNFVVRCEKRS